MSAARPPEAAKAPAPRATGACGGDPSPPLVGNEAAPAGPGLAPAARLQALRGAVPQPDPVQLHALESLARRLPGAPEPVRRVLEGRLDAALTALASRGQATPPPQAPATARMEAASVLAELTRHLRQARQQAQAGPPDPALPDPADGPEPTRELASVRRFRQTWQRIAAEDRVRHAVGRAPANAGPLNSHRLVLRSLELLHGLSPHYLNRFVSQIETLQWLEQASPHVTPPKSKPARRSRAKKP